MGAKISSIGENAFSDCSSLTSIYCKAKTPPTYDTGFSRDLYLNCNLYIPFETEESYKQSSPWNNFWNISESSECVSDFTCGDLIYSVTSGDNVTIIGNNITEHCDLKIPTHVEYFSKEYNVVGISENAFKGTSLLSSIFIPQNITYISNDAFTGCSGLKSIEFEYGEKILFIGCNSSLHLSSSITPYPNASTVDEKRTGFRNGYYDGLFYDLPIERIVINRNIESSKYYERLKGKNTSGYATVYNDIVYYPPFYGLTNLKSVEIGENVSAICKNQIEAVANAVPVTMDYTNFGKCDSIEVVVSNNPNAPIGGGFSQTVYEKASLFLPNGGVASYKEDDYWKNFSNMSETPFLAIESISFESDEFVLDINESRNLQPILYPEDASIKKLSWSSSKPSIVQVSDDGVITTSTREGEATVTATACDGTGISASIKVVVQKATGISSIYNNTKPIIYAEGGKLYISGKSELEAVEIYNIQGMLIESSKDSVIDMNSHGIYMIKIGGISKTVIL